VALQGSYLNDVRFHPDSKTPSSPIRRSCAIVLVDLEPAAKPRLDGHRARSPKGVEVSVGGRKLQRRMARLQVAPTALLCAMAGRFIGRR
jgi:hypothetical protein